jgi:hypothetical protein
MELEFVDEPPQTVNSRWRRDGIAQQFAEALKANPGKWARYPGSIKSTSSLSVYRRNFPDLEWAGRKNADGRCDVYARARI